MNIGQIKAQLGRKFRGSSIDDIQGISDYSLFTEAGKNVMSEIDPYETVRLHRFNLFTGVTEYAPPTDLKGKKIIDPAPQDGRAGEDYTQTFTKEFARDEREYKISVEYEDGAKVMKVRGPGKGKGLIFDNTEALAGWTAAGGASGLEIDSDIRLDGSDSLRFDLGATGGYVENAANSEVDASVFEDSGSFFRKVYIPSGASLITSITLFIGSSSGNYWTIVGTPHFGSWRNGVNLIRFDWASAGADTGTPDSDAIDYERLTFVTTAAIADVRVGPLSVRAPHPYETPYYSNNIFIESGTFLATPEDATGDKDAVNIILEEEAVNIFFYECCRIAAEDLSLDDEAEKFEKKLYGVPGKSTGLYAQYKEDKPTEKLRPQQKYIDLSRRPRRGAGFRTRLR